MHRRVVGREAVRGGVLGQFGQAQWLGVADQLAEDAVPGGQRADPFADFVADADGQERGQLPVVADDAQRPVLGVHQGHGGLHDAAQHLGQVELPADGHDGFEESVEPVPGPPDLVDARLELVEQFVEAQPRQPCVRRPRVLPAHRNLRSRRAPARRRPRPVPR